MNSFVLSGISVSGMNVKESSLDRRHVVVSCTLSFNETSITTHALIDTEATGYAFMDKDFVSTHNIPTLEIKKLSQPSALAPLPHNPCHSHPCNVTHFLGSFPYE